MNERVFKVDLPPHGDLEAWEDYLRRLHGMPAGAERRRIETAVARHTGAACRLVIYGSLAPGERNADQLAGLEGTWSPVKIRGMRHPEGWGITGGYPGFRWDGSRTEVEALLFESPELPGSWERLDRFEGPAYRRILVPAHQEEGAWMIAYVYEAGRDR
jgi:gamma-glutamylcyclotransferase (GGCT)/AIG2-like uncharacterized protein YtfP